MVRNCDEDCKFCRNQFLHGWLGHFPKIARMGGRYLNVVLRKMQSTQGMQVSNKLFESTLLLSLAPILKTTRSAYLVDGKTNGTKCGGITWWFGHFGLIKQVKSTLCYDGQNFFDADRFVCFRLFMA